MLFPSRTLAGQESRRGAASQLGQAQLVHLSNANAKNGIDCVRAGSKTAAVPNGVTS
jgi:hypothetical protein